MQIIHPRWLSYRLLLNTFDCNIYIPSVIIFFSPLNSEPGLIRRLLGIYVSQCICEEWYNFFYVPQPQKLVFPLQLRVKQCCIFRYRGIQCRSWTSHAHYSLTAERNLFLILLLFTSSSYSGTQYISYSSCSQFFFVQRLHWLLHKTDKIKMAGTSRQFAPASYN